MSSNGQNNFSGGMVDVLSPDIIPENSYAYGKNVEIRDFRLSTRRASKVQFTVPCLSLDSLNHAIMYNEKTDDSSNESLLILADGMLYKSRLPEKYTIVPFENTLTDSSHLRLFQAFGNVYILGGKNQRIGILQKSELYGPFTEYVIVDNPAPSIGDSFPNTNMAVYVYNRIWCVCNEYTINVSDVLVDTFDLTGHSYDINSSTDNSPITAIIPYSDSAILIFKKNSVYLMAGCNGDISGLSMSPLDIEHGCVGPDACVQVGSDVWYVSDDGIRSIYLTMQSKAQMTSIPISNNIRKMFNRINNQFSYKSTACVVDNYVIFGIPADGNTRNSTMLVYDTTLQTWVGEWTQLYSGMFVKWKLKNKMLAIGTDSVIPIITSGSDVPSSNVTKFSINVTTILDGWFQDNTSSNLWNIMTELGYSIAIPASLLTSSAFGNSIDGFSVDVRFLSGNLNGEFDFSAINNLGKTLQIQLKIYSQQPNNAYLDFHFFYDGVRQWNYKWNFLTRTYNLPSKVYNIGITHNGTSPVFSIDGVELTSYFTRPIDTNLNSSYWFNNVSSITSCSFLHADSFMDLKVLSKNGGTQLQPVMWMPFMPNSNTVLFPNPNTGALTTGVVTVSPVLDKVAWTNVPAPLYIPFEVITRSYNFGSFQKYKHFTSGEITVLNRGMNLSVNSLTRSSSESLALITSKSYTYLQTDFHGGTPWDGTTQYTFNSPGRSCRSPFFLPNAGMTMDASVGAVSIEDAVEHTEAFYNGKVDSDYQLQILNNYGSISVRSLAVKATNEGESLRRNR